MISLQRMGSRAVQCVVVLVTACITNTSAPSQTPATPSPGRTQAISYHVFGEPSRNEPKIQLVIFSSSQFSLRVIDNGTAASSPAYPDLRTAMLRNRCLAGINGGFFDPTNFTPAGLMVSDGRIISSFDAKGWQEGVLAVRNEAIELTERDAFAVEPATIQGLQSSPWLIRSGRIEPAHKSDSRRASRAFVAVGEDGLWAIGTSTPATFQEVAETLLSAAASQRISIRTALAMDGATSAGFWANVNGTEISDPERTTVRNFIGIVPLRADDQSDRVIPPETERMMALEGKEGAPTLFAKLGPGWWRILLALVAVFVVVGVPVSLRRRRIVKGDLSS